MYIAQENQTTNVPMSVLISVHVAYKCMKGRLVRQWRFWSFLTNHMLNHVENEFTLSILCVQEVM